MVKIISSYLLVFHLFGTFCLPMGDFSIFKDLPKIYNHCKATEDKDMTLLDFFTDHLVNIDGLLDEHGTGDEQKPHQPIQAHVYAFVVSFQNNFSFVFNSQIIISSKKLKPLFSSIIYSSAYLSKVFRPPNFA